MPITARLAGVAVAFALVAGSCGNEPGAGTASAPTAEPEPGAAVPDWEALPDPPLRARSGAAIAWTGDEIVVFGGSTFLCPDGAGCAAPKEPPFRDGAAFDPKTRTWRPIADAPIPIAEHLSPVTLGGDVYVVAPWPAGREEGDVSELLRYRPGDDRWDRFRLPTAWVSRGLAAANGTSVVVYPSSDERGELPDLRFDPVDGTWSELPPDPLSPAFDRRYVLSNDRLHLFAKRVTRSPNGDSGPSLVQTAILDGETWKILPEGDVLSFWSAIEDDGRIVSVELGCADGGEVNNFGRCIPMGGVFDAGSGTWSTLPDPPQGEHARAAGAHTLDEVLLTRLDGWMLDLTSDTWFELPAIPGDGDGMRRPFAGAGPYGVAVGGGRFGGDHPNGAQHGDAWLWSPKT